MHPASGAMNDILSMFIYVLPYTLLILLCLRLYHCVLRSWLLHILWFELVLFLSFFLNFLKSFYAFRICWSKNNFNFGY